MLSKLLRGGTRAAEPICWQEHGTPTPAGVQPMTYAAATAGPSHDVEIAALREQAASLQADAERRVREARQAGQREGEAAARQAAQAQVQPVLEKLAEAAQQIAALRPRLRMEAEQDLVRLAIAIARRIVNRELSVDPEALGGIVRAGLDRLRVEEAGRLRVHPDHQAKVREILARSAGLARVEVVADPAQERGAAVFETEHGNLDLSVDTQFQEIERGLSDRLRRPPQ